MEISDNFKNLVKNVEDALKDMPPQELDEKEQAALYMLTRLFSYDYLFRKTVVCFVDTWAKASRDGESLAGYCCDLADVFLNHSFKPKSEN